MALYNNIVDSFGGTPLVRLGRLSDGLYGNIFAKLEYFNPLGSVKDRIGVSMIRDAEIRGLIDSETLIVEPTSGNTGIALAYVCASKGYSLCLTMPDSMSVERRKLFVHMGARLELTPAAEGMNGAIRRAREIAESRGNTYMPNQFANPANPRVHAETTGPEILKDTCGDVDYFVSGVGTGGTITGVSTVLKQYNPNIKSVAVEPTDSPVISGGAPGPHKIQGIGAGFIPENLNMDIVDDIITVDNESAFDIARKLAKHEGLLCGISSGAAVKAAMEIAARPENKGKNIVTVLPSTGERYISTELFN